MNKTSILWMILNSVFLILFNTVFFSVGGTDHKASVWISWGFIHFAYIMLLLTPKLTRGRKSWTALGFPLYLLSVAYFFVEFFVGVFFILISLNGYIATLLVQLFLAGLYGITLVANLIANEYTVGTEEKRKARIDYVKNASVELRGLLERIDDKEAKKKIERVYDAIYSSPVKSHPDLAQMENHILESIHALNGAVSTGDMDGIIAWTGSLETAINERNSRLKTYN